MQTQITRTLAVSLLAGSMALSFSANAAEGLYSADDLMDAAVFDSSGEEVGEVEDILLDDGMALHSVIIETGGILGMGGREIVAERGSFTVQTKEAEGEWDDIDYEVHVEASQDAIKQFPEYNEGWWNQAKQTTARAWEDTKEGAASAWESTKEATSSAWRNIREGAEDAGDEAQDATNQ